VTPQPDTLLDRSEERKRLDGLLAALAKDGTGGVVLVEGPAGIGKSSLVAAALEEVPAGFTVLRAHGTELESGLAFGAARDLFGEAVARLPAAEREQLFDGPAGLARPVLGFGTSSSEAVGGDPLYGLLWLAGGLAERSPVVVVVDDLHWLDEESARFVAYLARRLEGLPILLIALARPDEPGTDAGPVTAVAEHATVIRLTPLSAEAVGRLVPGRSAGDVHRVTGGNPLLVVELARSLEIAEEDLPLDRVGPANVGRQVLRRVARVSEEAVALSRAVALSPEALTLADAAALAELESDDAATAADALVRAQVLRHTDGRLEFLHPVMRTAVYEELDPFARRTAHTRAARLLTSRGADVEEIAAHLLAGEPEGDPESIRILRAAAERARGRAALRGAVRYLERALEEPPAPGQERVDLRHDVARLQALLGRVEAIETLEVALEEATLPGQRADIAVDLAEALIANERLDAAIGLLEGFREQPELDPEHRLQIDTLALVAALDSLIDPHLLQRYASRIPRDLPGETAAQRKALLVLAYQMLIEGEPSSVSVELLERTLEDRDLRPLSPTEAVWQMRVMSLCGRGNAAEELAREQLERARETGAEAAYAGAQLQLAVTANQRGALREAEAAARLGLEAPGLQPDMEVTLEDWLLTTLSMQGRFDEVEELLERITSRERDSNMATAMLDRRRMEIALDRGDYEAALGPAERVYRATAGRIPPSNSLQCDYAVALAAVGRIDEAIALAREALDIAIRSEISQAIGIAHLALGRVLPGTEGLEHLEQSVAVLRQTSYRWNLANAEVALGAALRRANQRVAAREHLASALEYAVANGAAPIEAQAREELRLCGARPRRVMRTGVDALTPSEERIARLAADGKSNKEIAQHLFLTVKTVEMHLGGAFRKLDVRSRRELPDVFAAHSAA
jgi:DNA-binding CsgD family transcriptional regulator